MILLVYLTNGPSISGLDAYFAYLAICVGIGTTLLFVAIWGFLYVPTVGNLLLRLNVKSTGLRVGCFLLSAGFFAVAIWMIRHFSSFAINLQMTK